MKRATIEICIASAEDAAIAAENGADRVEVNTALALGGLTPSLGLFGAVTAAAKERVRLVAMIRPRPGGFCYSTGDLSAMQADIDALLGYGADGVVFGALRDDGSIDRDTCRRLARQVEASRGGRRREIIFHRAFDFTPRPLEAMEQLIDLGFTRILTSGQRPTAIEGAELIAELVRQANGRIEILPGAGVRPHNVARLRELTGCDQFHASLREPRRDGSVNQNPKLSLGAHDQPSGDYDATSAAMIAAFRQALED